MMLGGRTIAKVIAECVIPGKPVPKGRARVTKSGHSYTPSHTQEFESKVGYWLKQSFGDSTPAYDGPIYLDVTSVLRRPKRLMRATDPAGLVWCPSRPDLDNLVKAVSDAAMGAGVIVDDGQIVAIYARKLYAEKDGEQRTEVRISAV